MVFCNCISLLTLLFLLSTFLYFVGFFLPCTVCVYNHFFVKRHYFMLQLYFVEFSPFEVFLKGLGRSCVLGSRPVGLALELEERTPSCCWNLCGGRERPERGGVSWLGRALSSHLQSPLGGLLLSESDRTPLARLCGEGFAPGSRSLEKRRVDSELRRTGLALSLALESL